ncbi:hypothetical protein NP233_g1070 [Leucocoprinus birnbaumii]|uniref:SET domain-containing protein n=1 Tax=Leucocoprinus birnbaumii TaxID=56174 RepID=A0AAD5YZU4_9AGAR|nr:hypothetical protein NP233_g1070 [Leucocoprinus birnbaumii]
MSASFLALTDSNSGDWTVDLEVSLSVDDVDEKTRRLRRADTETRRHVAGPIAGSITSVRLGQDYRDAVNEKFISVLTTASWKPVSNSLGLELEFFTFNNSSLRGATWPTIRDSELLSTQEAPKAMPVHPGAVNPTRVFNQPQPDDTDRTSSASPGSSQPRATPNFSRPLPLSPTSGSTAPLTAGSPSITGQFAGSASSFSRPLPSVPDATSRQSLDYPHGGRGSGLGTRIIDDRDDPDDDVIIPGPTLRQPQSHSPIRSYEDSRRTSSALTESDLLYASAPSTPLRIPGELSAEEVDISRDTPSGSQTTHEAPRRDQPSRRATVAGGEPHHDLGEGSLTPKRAATTDQYTQHYLHPPPMPVPQLPHPPEASEQHQDDEDEPLEYSDDMDPYLRKLVDNFDVGGPTFPELRPDEQITDPPQFPDPQPHPQPLVFGLPDSDAQPPASPQSDNDTVQMSMPSAYNFSSQEQHDPAWKSYASSSLHAMPGFGDHLVSSGTPRHSTPPVIAGTNLEFEPLQSPYEQADLSTSSPAPGKILDSTHDHESPIIPQLDPINTHTSRPLPPFPPVAGQLGTAHGADDDIANNGEPVTPTKLSPVAPLRITKHARTPSSTTPIPPGAAAPSPPAYSSSPDFHSMRQSLSARPPGFPVPGSSSSQGQQPSPLSPAKGVTSDQVASPVQATSQADVQHTVSGVHSGSKADLPKSTVKNTTPDRPPSRVHEQLPAIPGTSSQAARKETQALAPVSHEEARKTTTDQPVQKQGNGQATKPTVVEAQAHDPISKPHTQPLPQDHRPGAPANLPPPPSQPKPPPPPPTTAPSKSQPTTAPSKPQPQHQPQPQSASDTTSTSGPRKRTSTRTDDTPSGKQPPPPRTLGEEKAQYNAIPPSSRSQYMQMLLALDDIPMIYNLCVFIFYLDFSLDLGNGVEAAVVNRIVNLPLFVVAFICTGIGLIGMGWLWWKWMKNYIWLTNRIFMPGLMNSLAGVISTLANIYGVQNGEFRTTSLVTISVTGGVGAVCGVLVLLYGVVLLGAVKKRHKREVGIDRAGKHGEGVWAGIKEKVRKRSALVASSVATAPHLYLVNRVNLNRNEIQRRLFENSPSPEPQDEQGTPDELWEYEVVSEEVTFDDTIRHEIHWYNWRRADGTTQTWHTLPAASLREWETIQRRRRLEVVRDSIDIDLSAFSGSDIHNFATCLRAQAYDDKLKLRQKYQPTLEAEMHELLQEKLSPDWNPKGGHPLLLQKGSCYSSSVGSAGRRSLRRSTVQRQQQQREPSVEPKDVAGPVAGPSTRSDSRSVQRPRITQTKLSIEWTEIASSAGAAPVYFINEVDDEEAPSLAPGFQYIEKGYIYADGIEKPPQDFQIGCSCDYCESPDACECQNDSEVAQKNGHKAYAYLDSGLFAFRTSRGAEVLECNANCSCKADCINRVAQRPRDVPIEIFKTAGKGWGVRASIDIPRGKVLGMYSGQIITRQEAQTKPGSCYIFDLDGQEDPENDVDGGPRGVFSVDAETCGNWARFVNHSCGPNLSIYLAVYDTIPSTNQPYITFVAHESIKAGTELTLDYDPGHADDDRMEEDVEGSVKECFCGKGDLVPRK